MASYSSLRSHSEEMHTPLIIDRNLSTEEARRLIDEAIERCNSASILVDLKSQRNSLAPISRLPPEILCHIFSIVKQESPLEHFEWVELTHVSRHWRTVGVGSPSLWAELPLTNFLPISWVKRMLDRSKDNPLVIKTGGTTSSRTVRGVKLALRRSERVKHLSLLTTREQWKEFQAAFPKSAPQLEHLSLFSLTLGLGSQLTLFDSEEVLSQTPKLRRLELCHFEFNWNTHSHLLRGLTYLRLHNISSSPQITWRQFSNILGCMPNLTFLYLFDACPTVGGQLVSWAPTHFALLQTVFIRSYPKIIETFFSCITFPSTTKIRIQCTVESDLSDLGMRLAQMYSNMLLDTCFQTLILLGSILSGVELRLFVDALTEEQMLAHNEIPAPLEFRFIQMPKDANHFTKAINDIFTSGLSLQNVSRVYFSEIVCSFQPGALANTIGKLNQLRYLIAEWGAGESLINALQFESHQEPDTQSAIQSRTNYFPNLTSLYFHESKFRDPTKYFIHIPVELLKDWLIQRSRSGAGLAKLKFKLCRGLFKSDIDLLRDTVEDLEWDEEELTSDYDSEEDDDEYISHALEILAYQSTMEYTDEDEDMSEAGSE